jgi:hypothetical protein
MARSVLRALICATALLAAFVAAAPASAGTYTVYSCGGPAGGYNGLFRGQADGGMTAYPASCPAGPNRSNDDNGLVARAVKQNGSTCWLCGAYLIMDAPGGAQIGEVRADVNMDRPYSTSPYWSLDIVGFGIDGDRGINTNAATVWGSGAPSSFSQAFYAGPVDVAVNKPSVRFEARCGAPFYQSCATYAYSTSVAYFSAWNISVDVNDSTLPSISNVDGELSKGGWLRGQQSITWNSSDNVGIRSARLWIDGEQVQSWSNGCDYTQIVPCSNLGGGAFAYDTDLLSDGSHSLTLDVTDTAGNANSWSRTIYTDHTAPAPPTVSRAATWQSTDSFSATVTNANGQAAPVTTITYEICDAQGANCGAAKTVNATQGGNGGQTILSGLTLPADGDYTVRAFEQDAAGNVSPSSLSDSSTAHLLLDRTPPAAPTGLASDGGGDWRSTNSFRLSWTNPGGQLAPIAKAYVVECDSGNNCSTASQAASNINQATSLTVPKIGDYTATVYLEDAAGNKTAANVSNVAHLRFDDTVPGGPQFPVTNGWINAVEAQNLQEPLAYQPSGLLPSGVQGYSYTTDGTDPDTTIDVPVPAGASAPYNASAVLKDVPEGDVVLKARTISGAGVAGRTFGVTTLHIDKTPPTMTAANTPDPGTWQRASVAFVVEAKDTLSGTTNPTGLAATDGAHITWRVDDGQPHNVAGATAQPSVTDDGVHTVYYRAYDLAGNPSPEQSAKVRIDVTAPIGSFEAIDANDPRKFVADVQDAASGVAAGTIQLRAPGGDWKSLDTSYDNSGHLVSKVTDDAQLPDGVYEARALVTDQAGNQGAVTTRRDGSPMQVAFPLRRPVTLAASTQVQTQVACRSVKVKSLRRGKIVRRKVKVCKRTNVPSTKRGKKLVLLPTITRKQYLFVQLHDSAGNPIKNAAITIADQPRTGGEFTERAHLATDGSGTTVYPIAPDGPSRTIRAAFHGTDQMKPASGDVSVFAPARTTIRVTPTKARRGKRAMFTGQLAGGYVPQVGKLVNLQVFFRGKWRTFATPRTNVKGAWRYAYRFTARYSRPLTYRFRAIVPREQAYPFEQGTSKQVKVTVRP